MEMDKKELDVIEDIVFDLFRESFGDQDVNYNRYTSEINDSEINTVFQWLGGFSKTLEIIGYRNMGRLKDYDFTRKNKPWEITIRIPCRKLWEKSKITLRELVKNQIKVLGASFRKDYPACLTIKALEDGERNLAYDGVPYFSHPMGDRTIDNLLVGSGTTVDYIIVDIASAKTAAMRFTNAQGRTLGIYLDTAVIPPELEIKFKEIGWKYIVDAGLTSAYNWYFLTTNEFIKPIIFVNIDGVNINVKNNIGDDSIEICADAICNIGYTFPHFAVKIVNK